MWHFLLLYSSLLVIFAMGSNKQWIPNTNWNNPENWNTGKPPCPQQNVLLNSPLTAQPLAVALPGDAVVQSLNLPMNGELIFFNDAELTFTGNSQAALKSCPDKGDIKFVAATKNWYNPANWEEVGNGGIPVSDPAASMLHLNQVPCKQDVVNFPKASSFSVKSDEPITVANVIVNGMLFSQASDFKKYYTSESGSMQFDFGSNEVTVANDPCNDPAGCVCNTDMFRDKICSFVKCPEARCDSPLEPDGTCCYVCGAVLTMTFSAGFKMKDFKQKVFEIVEKQSTRKRRDSVPQSKTGEANVSISRIEGNLVQVVVTDNGKGETAQVLAEEIRTELEMDDSTVGSFRTLRSGKSKQKRSSPDSGNTLAIAVGLAFGLVVVFALVVGLLLWRRKTRLHQPAERSAGDREMRSHSLSLIEEDENHIEMGEIHENNVDKKPTDAAPETGKDTNNLLYEGPHSPETFSNPLYDSASIEDIENAM